MAILRSSNPAFTRGAGFGAPTPGVDELERMYAGSDRLTVDDVVMHTLGLFAVLGIAAGFGWMLTGGDCQRGGQAEGVHDDVVDGQPVASGVHPLELVDPRRRGAEAGASGERGITRPQNGHG